jgi:hypothetical protein
MSGATRRSLGRLARPLSSGSRTGWATLAVGAALLLLGAGAWAARLDWFSAPSWIFVAWALALAAVAALVLAGVRSDGRYSPAGIARWLEERGVWRAGSLSALLDTPAPGTSPARTPPAMFCENSASAARMAMVFALSLRHRARYGAAASRAEAHG